MPVEKKYVLREPESAVDKSLVAEFMTQLDADHLVWLIDVGGGIVGVVWISTEDLEEVPGPSVTVRLKSTDENLRQAVIKEAISYAYRNLPYAVMNSRYETTDKAAAKTFKKIGFETDEKPYRDESGTEWQNVTLTL